MSAFVSAVNRLIGPSDRKTRQLFTRAVESGSEDQLFEFASDQDILHFNSKSGLKYGTWDNPLDSQVLEIDITNAVLEGKVRIYYQRDGAGFPFFVNKNGTDIFRINSFNTEIANDVTPDEVTVMDLEYIGSGLINVKLVTIDDGATFPAIFSSTVETAAPTKIVITFESSVIVDDSVTEAWSYIVNGGSATEPTLVEVDEEAYTVTLTMAAALTTGSEVVTFSYDPDPEIWGTNNLLLRSAYGSISDAITNSSVTNNV